MTTAKILTLVVDQETSGRRLDRILGEELKEVSRSYVQGLIKEGRVTLNGQVMARKNHIPQEGDVVEVSLPEPRPLMIEAEDLDLVIVYEDSDLIVINKPRGMVVHPAPGHATGTLVHGLMHHTRDLSGINGVLRPGILHRIDKDTTGLLLVAKNDEAHRRLGEDLKTHQIRRTYHTLVHGRITGAGTVDQPLARNPRNRLMMAVVPGGRRAVTHYEVLRNFGSEYTLLKVELETGRTHQIRAHMKQLGHPVVGDPLYGLKHEKFNLDGQLLHARELAFTHPVSRVACRFACELPEDFQKILSSLERKYPDDAI